jgi:putative transposase
MLNWAHFRFKTFLKMKAVEYSCKVIEVTEAYTSKTCSYCGRIQNIGSKKNLVCKCGISVDRDFNGARGIFLKTFTENTQGLGGYALPEFNRVVNLSNFVRSC